MPVTTYLGDREGLAVDHKTLAELLLELRSITGDDWRILTNRRVRSRWFRKPVIEFGYTLLVHIVGAEYQIVNFYRDGTDWSINTSVPPELIVAYAYGQIGGLQREQRRVQESAL